MLKIVDDLNQIIEDSDFVFGNHLELDHIKFQFSFKGRDLADFVKRKNIRYIVFSECVFCESVNFSGIKVFHDYECNLVFRQCIFQDIAIFNGCSFDYVSFEKSLFKETASFIKANFFQEPSFFHTEFKGIALFRATKFKGNAVFIDTKFDECTQFDGIQASELRFENCKMLSCIEFKSSDDHVSDFRIDSLSLKDTQLVGRIDLDWEKDKVYQLLCKGNSDKNDLIKQLAVLKELYHNQGDYKAEDAVYVALMDEKIELYKKDHEYHKCFTLKLIRLISTYGTQPFRILATIFVSIVIFGVGYFAVSALYHSNVDVLHSLIYALHGLVSPIGDAGTAIALLSSVECIWGLLLMAYLSATIVRKIIR